jgi:CHAT domain-containing protein
MKFKKLMQGVQKLVGLNQGDSGSKSSGGEAIAFEPVMLESSIPWPRLTRQYLALRHEEILEQAITEARRSGEPEVAGLLRALQEQNWEQIEGTAPRLFHLFVAAGSKEESATVALVGLDPRVALAEKLTEFPVDQQAVALDISLRACQEAAVLVKALGDEPCQSFYKAVEGTTHVKWGHWSAAEAAFGEALNLRRKLAQDRPQDYEPKVAATLSNLGSVFSELGRSQEAVASYQEALELYRRLGQGQQVVPQAIEAGILRSLGNVYSDLRRLPEAEAAYQEGLQLYRKLAQGQPEAFDPDMVMTLKGLGNVLRYRRRLPEAGAVYKEALQLSRKLAQSRPEVYESDVATALYELGSVFSELSCLKEAEVAYREALELYRRLAQTQPEVHEPILAFTLCGMGNVLRRQRRAREAEAACLEALKLFRKPTQGQTELVEYGLALTYYNLAVAFVDMCLLTEAEAAMCESLKLRRKLAQESELELDLATALNGLGNIFRDLRRLPEAKDVLEEALGIYRMLAQTEPEVYEPSVAMTLNNLGNVLWDLNRLLEAETAYQEGLKLYRKLVTDGLEAFDPGMAMMLTGLGNVLRELSRLPEAEAAYREGLKLWRKLAQGEPEAYEPSVARALNNLGGLLVYLNRLPEAEAALQEGLTLCRRYNLPLDMAKTLSGLGQVRMAQVEWGAAAEALTEAVEQVEQLRAKSPGLDRRMQILRENIHIYERLLICLMKLGRYAEALEVAERGKSRTLIDLLTLRDLRPKNAPSELAHEYERMLFRARALEDRLQRGEAQASGSDDLPPEERSRRQQEQIKSVQDERLRTNVRLQELVKEIRGHDPDFLPHARPLNLAEIKSLAQDAQATLMLFRVTEAGSFIFLVFPDGATDVVQEPEFTTAALNEMLVKFDGGKAVDGWMVRYYGYQAAAYQAQQTKKEEDEEAANQAWQAWLKTMDDTLGAVYQRLLKRAHEQLKQRKSGDGVERVVMIPNRGLAVLPLHACWWNGEDGGRRYMLDDYVVTYAPSLSVFKRCLERERAGRSRQTLLGVANPKPPGNLAFSEWECEEIEEMLGDERCLFLWGEEATKAELMKWVGERNWLHFSCHGQYRLDEPMSSALSLAQEDELSLGEILEKLNLQHTWLTVLSACETGLVDFREIADEHYGLPLGFLFAGAPTVWGTLWTVNDLTTALLMIEAYKNLTRDGASKPDALRDAQRWLRDATAERLLALVAGKETALGYERMAWHDVSPFRRRIESICDSDPQARLFDHPYFWAGMQCVGV